MGTERPILFSTPMIKAILEGRKSQTRRIVKLPKNPFPTNWNGGKIENGVALFYNSSNVEEVRVERLQDINPNDAGDEGVEYFNVDWEAFEGGELVADYTNYTWTAKRENDPTYEDRHFPTFANPIDSYRSLWQSINGPESWKQNPWVWVIRFKRV